MPCGVGRIPLSPEGKETSEVGKAGNDIIKDATAQDHFGCPHGGGIRVDLGPPVEVIAVICFL